MWALVGLPNEVDPSVCIGAGIEGHYIPTFLRSLVTKLITSVERPTCKAQMRIISFMQDEHSIKDIMKAQSIPDFQAPPPIPKFIDTVEAIDELPEDDAFDPAPDDF